MIPIDINQNSVCADWGQSTTFYMVENVWNDYKNVWNFKRCADFILWKDTLVLNLTTVNMLNFATLISDIKYIWKAYFVIWVSKIKLNGSMKKSCCNLRWLLNIFYIELFLLTQSILNIKFSNIMKETVPIRLGM